MNELKPEDVMRALECCQESANFNCWDCPYNNTDRCHYLKNDALALLRDKYAHIKELEEAVGAEFTCFVGEPHKVDRCPYVDALSEKDAEIERLKKANQNFAELENGYIVTGYKNIRAEAITEFAERLKSTLIASGIYPVVVKNNIEKIAKELKGETNV